MKRTGIFFVVFSFALSCVFATLTWSHPGRTDSSGGHYNRKTGEYHFHGGKTSPNPSSNFSPSNKPDSSYQKTQTKEGTVYITRTGKKYHSSNCRYLSKSKIVIDIKKAQASGYSACKVCGGIPVKTE